MSALRVNGVGMWFWALGVCLAFPFLIVWAIWQERRIRCGNRL
jgi:predicted outer membrane lipoprotein